MLQFKLLNYFLIFDVALLKTLIFFLISALSISCRFKPGDSNVNIEA